MATITYPLGQLLDNSGTLLTAPVVTIASVTDKAGNGIGSPGATVNGSGGATPISVDYDAETHGEAWITFAVSQSGHTITGQNASPALYCARDSSRILTGINSSGQVDLNDAEIATDVQTGLTSQGYTTARASLLDDLSTILTNVNTAITNISGIPTNLLSTVVDGTITVRQVLALDQSIVAGKYANTPAPSGGGTQTTTYYRADGTTVLATDTVTINSSGGSTARAVSFSNLP